MTAAAEPGPLGMVLLASAGVVALARWGVGAGYAFWTGALGLALLRRLDFEEAVDQLSSGIRPPWILWLVWILVSASMLGRLLGMRGLETGRRLEAWIRASVSARLAGALSEGARLLLPRPGGDLHGAGEPEPPLSPRLGPWLSPIAELGSAFGPLFLLTLCLSGVLPFAAWTRLLALFVLFFAVGAWARSSGAVRASAEEAVPPSPEGLLWIAGLLGTAAAGLPMLGLATGAGIVLCLLRLRGARGALRAAFHVEGTVDLIVLAVGVPTFIGMASGVEYRHTEAIALQVQALSPGPWARLLAPFALATAAAAVSGRVLVGAGAAWPLLVYLRLGALDPARWPMAGAAVPVEPEALVAVLGGAVVGAALRPFSGEIGFGWERARSARAFGASAALLGVSLLPGLVRILGRGA